MTSSGLHGANRLASNSLLEGLVFGASAGYGASQAADKIEDDFQAVCMSNDVMADPTEPLDIGDILNSLKSLMWRDAGVLREKRRMEAAAKTIDTWCYYVLPRQFSDPSGWELQNMLLVSRLILKSALEREESRGVHQRIDFPNQDNENWNRHVACSIGSEK